MRLIWGNVITKLPKFGSPHWKHSELMFEKKGLIPDLQQLLTEQVGQKKGLFT